ncbi:hypothetical protein [Umezawaea beigongshangensis]|uniref:hypothetical protein n=1 Tax=Umezawaea beigongshangensis TaxID=2780383 RepID=UPI0018F115A3|nr:hypothetical protein [Umezawaea beigongshangensis]
MGRRAALLMVDLATAVAELLAPLVWSLIAMSVVAFAGRAALVRGGPTPAGLVVGSLSTVVVLLILLWADRRHGWWRS